MYAELSQENRALRDTVRAFLARHSAEEAVRRCMMTEKGYDPRVWRKLAGELGVHGLAIPERFGGTGAGWLELGIVLEEMGRTLFCAPFFSSVVLAASALLQLGDDAVRSRYLPGIASGETVATLTITQLDEPVASAALPVTAKDTPTGWRLNGTAHFVLDGLTADLILVVAGAESTLGVFVVPGTAAGLTRHPMTTMDLTRKQATLDFHDTPAELIAAGENATAALHTVLQLARVALATEQLGGASRVLEMSVEYAKSRQQFGRPIGSFQAIKHKCADMLIEVESARSAVFYAIWAADRAPKELPVASSLAKAYCSDAFAHTAAETIQVHGGIGFTWEHPAHLYYKRAKSSEVLLGHPTRQRELVLQHLGI